MNKYKVCFYALVALWALFLVWVLMTPTQSTPAPTAAPRPSKTPVLVIGDVHKPAQEPETYEDYFRKNATVIEECKITHYCTEQRKHICGTGDGITSTGVPVTAGWTCAVDPETIPYGAEVMIDYGDRVEFWKAQDCGGGVNGNHIDLAVETHEEALELGVLSATVYWMEVS